MYRSWKKDLTEQGVILIGKVRESCLEKGFSGFKKLCQVFRAMDIDYSRKLSEQELKEGLKKYLCDVNLTDDEFGVLFMSFDSDRNRMIDFNEFLLRLKPEPSSRRKATINEVFQYLDQNGDGYLKTDDIRVRCREQILNHVNYLSGKWSEQESAEHFLRAFDNPDEQDGKVTREEFLDYYIAVSASIEDDDYFDLLMKKSFNIPAVNSKSQPCKR